MKIFFTKTSQKGFTLLETMIALFIFSVAFTGLLVVSSKGLQSIRAASNLITAQLLAQEGIELVENKKMDNFLTFAHVDPMLWPSGLDNCMPRNNGASHVGCQAEAVQLGVSAASLLQFTSCLSSCDPLIIDTSSGIYGYSSSGASQQTPFTRTITLEVHGTDNHMTVYSTIDWSENGVARQVVAQRELGNWFRPVNP